MVTWFKSTVGDREEGEGKQRTRDGRWMAGVCSHGFNSQKRKMWKEINTELRSACGLTLCEKGGTRKWRNRKAMI